MYYFRRFFFFITVIALFLTHHSEGAEFYLGNIASVKVNMKEGNLGYSASSAAEGIKNIFESANFEPLEVKKSEIQVFKQYDLAYYQPRTEAGFDQLIDADVLKANYPAIFIKWGLTAEGVKNNSIISFYPESSEDYVYFGKDFEGRQVGVFFLNFSSDDVLHWVSKIQGKKSAQLLDAIVSSAYAGYNEENCVTYSSGVLTSQAQDLGQFLTSQNAISLKNMAWSCMGGGTKAFKQEWQDLKNLGSVFYKGLFEPGIALRELHGNLSKAWKDLSTSFEFVKQIILKGGVSIQGLSREEMAELVCEMTTGLAIGVGEGLLVGAGSVKMATKFADVLNKLENKFGKSNKGKFVKKLIEKNNAKLNGVSVNFKSKFLKNWLPLEGALKRAKNPAELKRMLAEISHLATRSVGKLDGFNQNQRKNVQKALKDLDLISAQFIHSAKISNDELKQMAEQILAKGAKTGRNEAISADEWLIQNRPMMDIIDRSDDTNSGKSMAKLLRSMNDRELQSNYEEIAENIFSLSVIREVNNRKMTVHLPKRKLPGGAYSSQIGVMKKPSPKNSKTESTFTE